MLNIPFFSYAASNDDSDKKSHRFLDACKFGNAKKATAILDAMISKGMPPYVKTAELLSLIQQKDTMGNTPLHYICIQLAISENAQEHFQKKEELYKYNYKLYYQYHAYRQIAALMILYGANQKEKNEKGFLPKDYYDYNNDDLFNKTLEVIRLHYPEMIPINYHANSIIAIRTYRT